MEYIGKQTDSKDLATVGMGITGASVGDIIKVKSVDAYGKPTAWDVSNTKYELIEKIIIGYSVTTEKPADWDSNWQGYYRNIGTLRNPEYVSISDATAPEWEAGVYYSYTSDGVRRCERSVEPDGTPYSFLHLLGVLKFNDPDGSHSGAYIGYYFQAWDGGNYLRAGFRNTGVPNRYKAIWWMDIDGKLVRSYFMQGTYAYEQTAVYGNSFRTLDRTTIERATLIGVISYNSAKPSLPSGSIVEIYAIRE